MSKIKNTFSKYALVAVLATSGYATSTSAGQLNYETRIGNNAEHTSQFQQRTTFGSSVTKNELFAHANHISRNDRIRDRNRSFLSYKWINKPRSKKFRNKFRSKRHFFKSKRRHQFGSRFKHRRSFGSSRHTHRHNNYRSHRFH